MHIGFSTSPGPLSWLIRRVTRSEVSHCFLVVPFAGIEMVLEASENDYRLIPYDVFCRKNTVVCLAYTLTPLDPALPMAARWLGSHYDFAGLAGNALVAIGRWCRRRWRNPARSDDVQFCSESVVRVLRAVNHPGTMDLDPDSTSPQDLLDFLRGEGARIVPPEDTRP